MSGCWDARLARLSKSSADLRSSAFLRWLTPRDRWNFSVSGTIARRRTKRKNSELILNQLCFNQDMTQVKLT